MFGIVKKLQYGEGTLQYNDWRLLNSNGEVAPHGSVDGELAEFTSVEAAHAWLVQQPVKDGDQFMVVLLPKIEARTTVTLVGITPPAPIAAVPDPTVPPPPKRPRRSKTDAPDVGAQAGSVRVVTGEPPLAPTTVTVEAVAAETAPAVTTTTVADLPPGITPDDVADRAPLPVAPVAPFVDVRDKTVQVFDGTHWFFSICTHADNALRMAQKVQSIIDKQEMGALKFVTGSMRAGRANGALPVQGRLA